MKKICIISTSRADYHLLKNVIKKIQLSKKLTPYLIVSGSHLEKRFGNTFREILKDKVKINKKIKILNSSSNKLPIINLIGDGIKKFGKIINDLNPDAILILGDRYEILCAGISGLFLKIPIIHLYGGEVTEGAIDENIRHAMTKFSSYHFVSNAIFKKRVEQLGENPKNIICVGSLGVENIKKIKFISKKELENKLKIKLMEKNYLVTYHPETYKKDLGLEDFKNLLFTLKKLKNTFILFTGPNADLGNEKFDYLIKNFVKKNKNSKYLISLGQLIYFSCAKQFDGVIGNSSSGVIEIPTIKTPTLNIGNRQRGRVFARSVINCPEPTKKNLKNKINLLSRLKSKQKDTFYHNPYYKKNTSSKIIKKLEKINFKKLEAKKFFDIKFK